MWAVWAEWPTRGTWLVAGGPNQRPRGPGGARSRLGPRAGQCCAGRLPDSHLHCLPLCSFGQIDWKLTRDCGADRYGAHRFENRSGPEVNRRKNRVAQRGTLFQSTQLQTCCLQCPHDMLPSVHTNSTPRRPTGLGDVGMAAGLRSPGRVGDPRPRSPVLVQCR